MLGVPQDPSSIGDRLAGTVAPRDGRPDARQRVSERVPLRAAWRPARLLRGLDVTRRDASCSCPLLTRSRLSQGCSPTRAPFLELRGALDSAEAHLNCEIRAADAGWRRLSTAVGRDDLSAAALNEMLAQAGCCLRLEQTQEARRLTMSSATLPSSELSALVGLGSDYRG